MAKKYVADIIQKYLKNRYSQKTEDDIRRWLVEDEHAFEKETLLHEHWDMLHVNPDIFIYESLEQVMAKLDQAQKVTPVETQIPVVKEEQAMISPIEELPVKDIEEPVKEIIPVIHTEPEVIIEQEEDTTEPTVVVTEPEEEVDKIEEVEEIQVKPQPIRFTANEPVETRELIEAPSVIESIKEPVITAGKEDKSRKEEVVSSVAYRPSPIFFSQKNIEETVKENVSPVDNVEESVVRENRPPTKLKPMMELIIDPDHQPLDGMEMNLGKYVPFRKRLLRAVAVLIPICLLGWQLWVHLADRGDTIYMQKIEIPYGDNQRVNLPDGSTVWLNAGSILEYPSRFNRHEERMVNLTGEGYFSVAKGASGETFIVKTPHMTVTVLGTEFNIKAYPDEPFSTTTLTKGSVKVEAGKDEEFELVMNQQLVYDHNSAQSVLHEVSPENGTVWRSGQLIFDHTSLPDILRTLERRYNVIFEPEKSFIIPEDTFSVKFLNNENISEVLYILQEVCDFNYQINENNIRLTKK